MRLFKRSSMFKSYLAYNLVLVLLPVIIFAPLFFTNAHAQLQSEILTIRRFTLEQVRKNIDDRFSGFGSMALYASLDPDLTPYQLKSGDYSTITALRHLRLHSSPLNFEEIFLYIHRHDMFYGTTGSLSTEFFEQLYTLRGGWSWADFYQMINQPHSYATSPAGCYLSGAGVRTDSFLVLLYPWTNSSLAYGTAIGLINVSFFESLISGFHTDRDSALYVLDQQGQILFAREQELGQGAVDHVLTQLAQTPDLESVKINRTTYLPVYLSSQLTGWQYLMLVPGSSITGILISEKMLLLFGLLIIVFCFAGLGIAIAMRYYRPIRKLGDILWGSDPARRTDAPGKEMQLIQDQISEIVHNNQSLRSELDENKEHVRQSLLYQIICGTADLDDATDRGKLDQLGISLIGPYYCVVILRFANKLQAKQRSLVLQILQQSGFLIVEALYKDYFAILMNTPLDQQLIRQDLALITQTLADFKTDLAFGVGLGYSDLADLRQSFIEAVAAVECPADKPVTFFDALTADPAGSKILLPSKAQIRLLEAIRQGNIQAVQSAADDLAGLLNTLHTQVDQIRLHFTISGIVQQLLPVVGDTAPETMAEAVNQLIYYTGIDDFMTKLTHFCLQLTADINRTRQRNQNQLFDQILAYIDAHYTEQELSLTGIADLYDMTGSTLSRLFSESTGMRFIDYLSDKRLHKARELLRQTDLGIREIVALVGYIDVSSFTRKFTSEFGQSPGRFRKQGS
jgi:AraC-like DNA-binding protein